MNITSKMLITCLIGLLLALTVSQVCAQMHDYDQELRDIDKNHLGSLQRVPDLFDQQRFQYLQQQQQFQNELKKFEQQRQPRTPICQQMWIIGPTGQGQSVTICS